MPAILPDAESVQAWLNSDISAFEAVDHLEPISRKEVT